MTTYKRTTEATRGLEQQISEARRQQSDAISQSALFGG